jgi:hypothetical protein
MHQKNLPDSGTRMPIIREATGGNISCLAYLVMAVVGIVFYNLTNLGRGGQMRLPQSLFRVGPWPATRRPKGQFRAGTLRSAH